MELLNRKLKTKNEEELISFGEEASGICLSEYLNYEFFDPKKIFYIKKNNEIEKNITFKKIIQKIKHKKNLIIPGFYGRNKLGKTKIMKRGGSDITGAYIAGALKLNSYENFTDSQILSVDPNIIKNPTPIKKLDVFELGNLSSQGFEIIHEDVVDLIRENRIKLKYKANEKYEKLYNNTRQYKRKKYEVN